MNKQLQLDSDRLYTGKEVAELTGYKADSIKKMCGDYEIETPRTEGGHRRFTSHNIEVLLAIKDKRENDKWSVKQIQDWLKGKETVFNTHIPKTQDEMKYERLETKYEQLEKAFGVVIQRTNQKVELVIRQSEEEKKQLLQMFEEEREKDRKLMLEMFEKQKEEEFKRIEQIWEKKFNSHIENRDNLLMATIRESQRESQQTIKETAASIEQLANYQEQLNKKPKTMRDRIAHWFGSSK